jgi:DNA-binding MarR family transcriptional regulator
MGFVKATVTRGFLLGLLALALLTAPVQGTHVGGSCTGHGAPPLTPCEAPDVPPPADDTKTGTAKVIPVTPKEEKTDVLEEIGAFFGAVGQGMGKGVAAIGSGAGAAFVGIGALILALFTPIASLLSSLRPDGMPVVLYAGMTAAGTAVVAGGTQFGLWMLLKKLFPLGIPLLGLFSRIDKDELLEHERRARIFELIKHNPGIHLSEIARELEYAWGTTLHHLRKLRADHLILFKDVGHHKSFFINGSGLSEIQMQAMSLVKNGTLAHLAQYLETHPRVSLKELSEALNISPPLAAFHIRKLEKAGFVSKVRDGKSVRLSTTQALPAGFFGGIAQSAPAPVAAPAPVPAS